MLFRSARAKCERGTNAGGVCAHGLVGDVGDVGDVAAGGANVLVCGITCVVVGASCVVRGAKFLFCISWAAVAGRSMITSRPPRTAASTAIDPRSATMVPNTTGKYINEAKNILRADALSTRR